MNWDAIGAIDEILGAGAVVVSLVYLADQTTYSQRTRETPGNICRLSSLVYPLKK